LTKGVGGLPKASVVNVSQVWTVNKADLDERIGNLPASVIDAIRSGLQLLFERY
jgi:mRNA interferase MazF